MKQISNSDYKMILRSIALLRGINASNLKQENAIRLLNKFYKKCNDRKS